MRSWPVRAVAAAVRGWTWLYTAGVEPSLRDARRDEIASDLWESLHDPAWSDPLLARQLAGRLVLGLSDDVWWRAEQRTAETQRRWRVGLTITAMLLLGFLLIAQSAMRSPAVPDLPQSLLIERLRLNQPRLIDPP